MKSTCRTCLTETNNTKTIRNTPLADIYEKLINVKLISENGKPEAVCLSCCCELEKCYNFALMAQQADSRLTQLCCDDDEMPKALPTQHSQIDASEALHSETLEIDVKPEHDTVKIEHQELNDIKEVTNENKTKRTEKNKHTNTECNYSYLNHDSNTKENYEYSTCDTQNSYNEHKHNLKPQDEKIYTCDRCGKTFPNSFQLKRHMRSHTGEKPYHCKQCDRAFSDRGNLKKHITSHTGEKSYICTECNASFTQNGNLKRHMRLHTGEKLFYCGLCGKSLPDASLLKRHMRIHTGERPFVCEACGKAYSDKSNFKTHIRRHTGEKPYKCSFCDYMTAHSICLKLHMAKKH